MLKTWLGKKGFLVDTAGNSARARKQLDAQSYNLVLSDLRLPDQDGISLLAWMKEHGHQIPLYYHDRLCRYPKCCTSHEKWCQ